MECHILIFDIAFLCKLPKHINLENINCGQKTIFKSEIISYK